MKTLKLSAWIFALVFVPTSIQASPLIPDLQLSEAFIAYPGPGMVTLLVVPDGSGTPFTEATGPAGGPVDATITLILRDAMGNQTTMANYPSEDMWLEFGGGVHLPTCAAPVRGLIADHNTNSEGVTHWTLPPKSGGFNEGPVFVFINGSALQGIPGLPVRFNSPDINGDLRVDLSDVSLLAGDVFGNYRFRSDLNADGVVNLSDVTVFAAKLGAGCP